jgi:hypothetical protein
MRLLRQRLIPAALSIAFSGHAGAFSQGSPICEVLQLPLVEMSPILAQPPPSGWRLTSDSMAYQAGEPITLRIVHAQPKAVRGVLLWSKRSPQLGSGQFLVSPNDVSWQYIPPPAPCEQWAITHRNALPKMQSELRFQWLPDGADQTLFRAFVIEDCGITDCRAHQALTSFLVLERALYRSGFEATNLHQSSAFPSSAKKKGRPESPLTETD